MMPKENVFQGGSLNRLFQNVSSVSLLLSDFESTFPAERAKAKIGPAARNRTAKNK